MGQWMHIGMRGSMWLGLIVAGLLSMVAAMAQPDRSGQSAPLLFIQGAIGPATADYIGKGIQRAGDDNAPIVLIEMNTPGGLDTAMRAIIHDILRSPVPVVTYVSPGGSRAASAGTYILYASHIAAMAPGTNLGAATPVQLGGPAMPGAEDKAKQGEKSASENKAINDAIAYIRALAELRGRNADWGEEAVRTAASLSASAALQQDVIDVVARDRTDLLAQLHGRTIRLHGGEITLDTQGLAIAEMPPNWRTRILATITDPNIALILMMIGVYGLLFEFMNPGALYPGTIGAICLLTGLYAFAILPLNYAGVALILLGIALMVAEAFTPSFGIMGIGGVAAFLFGAGILIDTDVPQFRIGWPVLGILALISLGVTLAIVRLGLHSQRRKVVSGKEALIGAHGVVLDWQDGEDGGRGHVFVQSERWNAIGDAELRPETPVRITAIDGLTLSVEPAPHRQQGE